MKDMYHEIGISHARLSGACHRKARHPCEDVVLLRSTPEQLFCGLADGHSGARYGAEGGQACLEAVWDYIRQTGLGNILETPFPDELPCAVTKAFRQRLLSLSADRSAALGEFASTLLALAVDLRTGA